MRVEIGGISESLIELYPAWAFDEGREGYLSVEVDKGKPLPRGVEFIRVIATSPEGRAFTGLIATPVPFMIQLYGPGWNVDFNRGLSEFVDRGIGVLFQHLDVPPFEVFPLHFRSEFLDWEGKAIEGQFDPRGKKMPG